MTTLLIHFFAHAFMVLLLIQHVLSYAQLFDKTPQAIIHLPTNVLKGKDRVHINHHVLSDYLSELKSIPETLHQHGQILAQLDHSQLARHLGQSVDSGRLPLISVTEQGAQPAKVVYEMHPDGYASPYVEGADKLTTQIGYADAGNRQSTYPSKTALNSEYESHLKQQPNYGSLNQNSGYSTGSQNTNSEYSNNRQQSSSGYRSITPSNYESNQSIQSEGYGSANKKNEYTRQSSNAPYSSNGHAPETMNGYELMSVEEPSAPANYNQNYVSENSPFDFNFVRDILNRVLQQLEQQQITPDQLQAYAEPEIESANGNYVSNDVKKDNEAYSGSSPDVNAKYEQSTPSVAYQSNSQSNHNTITYRMPTINYEMPLGQIDQLMQAISGGGVYGTSSQQMPVVIPSEQLQFSPNLNLGEIRTIAIIKSSRLPTIKRLPHLAAILKDGAEVGKLSYAASGEKNIPKKIRSRKNYRMTNRGLITTISQKTQLKSCDEEKKKK